MLLALKNQMLVKIYLENLGIGNNKMKILLLLITLFSFQLNAAEISNEISPECSIEISKLVDNSLQEFALEISNKAFGTMEESDRNDSTKLQGIMHNSCRKDFLINNLSNKVMYLIFGESVVDSLKISIGLFNIVDVEESEYEKVTGISTVIDASFLIRSLSSLISYFIIFLLMYVFAKLLLSARNGEVDKAFTMNILKIVTGISIVFPMDIFSGLSFVQFVTISGLVFGTLIASYTWAFSIFIIDFFTLKETLTSKEVAGGYIDDIKKHSASMVAYPLLDNVNAHICEIASVQEAFDDITSNSKKQDDITNSEFYNCLKNENVDISNLKEQFPNSPHRFLRTRACFLQNEILAEKISPDSVFCGEYAEVDDSAVYSDKFDNAKILKEQTLNPAKLLRDEFGFLDDIYQDHIRKIALLFYDGICASRDNWLFKSDVQTFDCVKQDIDYNYEFDTNGNIVKYHAGDNASEYLSLLFDDAINQSVNFLTSVVIPKITAVFTVRIPNNSSFDSLKSTLEYSIGNGWLGTPSIYFTTPHMEFNIDNVAENTFSSLEFSNKSPHYSDLRALSYTAVIPAAKVSSSTPAFDIALKKLFNKELLTTEAIAEKIKATQNETQSAFLKFSILNLFTMGDDGYYLKDCYIRVDEDKGLNDCLYSTINPFKNIVTDGKALMEATDKFWLLTYAIKTFTQSKADEQEKQKQYGIARVINSLAGFLSVIFGTLAAIGAFFGLALPLIPFLVFGSMIVGWIVQAFRSVLVVQFLIINYFLPNKGDDIEEGESKIYSLILNAIFTPFFIIMGATVSFMLIHVSIGLVNVSFSLVVEFFNSFDNNTMHSLSLMNIVDNTLLYVAYLVILTAMIISACSAMYKVPETIREWFGIKIDTNQGMFQQVRMVMQKVLFIQA
jgi:hypothetical protein